MVTVRDRAPKFGLLAWVGLVAVSVWVWLSTPELGMGQPDLVPIVASMATPDVVAVSDHATDGIDDLRNMSLRIPVGAISSHGSPRMTIDSEWEAIPRIEESALEALTRMRESGTVHFRSTYFNPNDSYIAPETRTGFSKAYREAVDRVGKLKAAQLAIGRSQIVELYQGGKFELTARGTLQLKGREHASPVDGWYTHVDQEGRQFEIRWNDLSWAADTLALRKFLLEQLDVCVVEFFFRMETIGAMDRELLLTYAVGDGAVRLERLRKVGREEFLRIRRALQRH